jgi:FkbM family methyltransferase
MLSRLSTLNRIKFWLADRFGLRRLFAATSYLLVGQLNADLPSEGPAGNRRLQDAFLDLCATLQPSLFLDVGANDGSASVAVRGTAPGCEVHAFEANPQIHAKHRERLQAQGVQYWNLAITDHVGDVVLYAPRTLSRAYIGGEVVPASIVEGEDTGKTSLLRRNEEATYAEFKVESDHTRCIRRRPPTGLAPSRHFPMGRCRGRGRPRLCRRQASSLANTRHLSRN